MEHVPFLFGIVFLESLDGESRRIIQQGVQHPLEAVRVSGEFPALHAHTVVSGAVFRVERRLLSEHERRPNHSDGAGQTDLALKMWSG